MKRIISLGLSLAFFNVACGSSSGSSLDSNNQASCAVSSDLIEQAMDFETLHPQVFDEGVDQYIVKTKSKVLFPTGNPVRTYTVKGLEIHTQKISDYSFTVEFLKGQTKTEVIEELMKSYDIEYIEPDFPVVAAASTEEVASKQWAHKVIRTYDAWNYTEGDQEVVVAVIDSGVDFDHPDLRATEWQNPNEILNGRDDDGNGLVDDLHGWDYVEKNRSATPSVSNSAAYHGTHVAGIIAGAKNPSQKVAGVAPRVKIMSLKFLNNEKSGYTSNAIKSIYYAINKKVKIINASWGSYNVSKSLQEAIQAAQKAGVLIVAASGNYGSNNNSKPFYPASYNFSNLLSVTASNKSDHWMSGINYGNRSVDFAAPGSRILSTDRNNGYKSRSGSSMAAPYAAGIAALALSIDKNSTYRELKSTLTDSADSLPVLKSRVIDGLRVNAMSTVQTANSRRGNATPTQPPQADNNNKKDSGSRFDYESGSELDCSST